MSNNNINDIHNIMHKMLKLRKGQKILGKNN